MPVPSLTEQALNGTISYLDNWSSREKKPATFVCGGCVAIAPAETPVISYEQTRRTSPPVRIYWHDKESTQNLVLPLSGDNNKNEILSQLPDTLDAKYFSSSFHPADYNILDGVDQVLLPGFSTHLQNQLGHQKISADLCGLNVISPQTCPVFSDNFVEKIDSLKSPYQLGSLVVCLPSPFKGGNMLVQNNDRNVVEFEWSSRSASNIQWAAFFSSCNHQNKGVSEGYRVTLVYSLYVTEPVGSAIIHDNPIIEPQSLPLYNYVNDLIAQPAFFKHDEGELGFYCAHSYPHNTEYANEILPRGLKGSDMALFAVLRALSNKDIETIVCPVIRDYGYDIDDDKSPLLGDNLHSVIDVHDYDVRDSIREIIMKEWPCFSSEGITWVNDPLHTNEALKILAHARTDRIMTLKSSVAIMACIPSWYTRAFGMQAPVEGSESEAEEPLKTGKY